MSKNKRITIAVAGFSLLGSLTLSGCGQDDDNPQDAAPSVEITHRSAPADKAPDTAPESHPTGTTSSSDNTAQTSPGQLGPEHDEGLANQPTHPSAAPTPNGFTWPEPSHHTPADPQGTPRGMPDLDSLDREDPEDTAAAFVQAIYSVDTRTDTSEQDAVRRATQLATAEYAAQLEKGGALAGGGEWLGLAQADGWVTVELEQSHDTAESPEDPDHNQWSSWVVDVTRHGMPKEQSESTAVAYVRLAHTETGWAVEHYESR